MTHKYHIGEEVTIPADEVLGTEPFTATIIGLETYGYYVVDDDGFTGPVSFDLSILQENC